MIDNESQMWMVVNELDRLRQLPIKMLVMVYSFNHDFRVFLKARRS
jgi:hypothetical protein